MFLLLGVNSCKETKPESEIPIAAMAIKPSSVEMNIDETQTLTIRVVPEGASGTFLWESSNEKVAVVDNGKVTAIAYGKTKIRVIDALTLVEAECDVMVNEAKREYNLVWSDEFETSVIDTDKWGYDVGGAGWGNQEAQYYTDRIDNSRIENGCLVIEAKKENYQGNSYTSARLLTKNKIFFTYGKVEARISLPSGKGTWPAFWMMPNNSEYGTWPRSGEIDIMEHEGGQPTMISHAVHTQQANAGRAWSSKGYYENVENAFHTYAVEWINDYNNGNDALIFYVDGGQTAINNQGNHATSTYADWPFDKDFYIILNLALGGSWGGTIDDSIFADKVLMKIDYVRVYELK